MNLFNLFQITIGFVGLVALAVPFSDDIKKINLKYIFYGILAQLVLALILLKVPLVISAFEILGNGVFILQQATQEGANFVFGYPPIEDAPAYRSLLQTFAFGVLPYVIVMSCISAILWYWGILPFIVNMLSKACQKLFNIGGPVGLGAAANVFIGQVEAPLLIRPYLKKLTNKELLILMTAGMATVAGSVMVALISILEISFADVNLIQHFITASVLSVPAAIMYSNIMIPSSSITEFTESKTPKIYKSTMDAITRGTSDGTSIAISVGTILIVVIALVYIVNSFLGVIGMQFGADLSIEIILGYIFAPIAWLMGIPWNEAIISGELLGIKTALNEFIAYPALANLEEGVLSDRSKLITFYGLCGFANLSSVGILISGLGAMEPERKQDFIDVSFKALIGATLASCMTGLVVGCFI
ncbi:Na+-dependent nucleoside transporter [Gammaproteobacteria bacterium]|jgi:concentrative nucleoside transporter, CNT family|nr:Na+-dependent nucleoside transporter [Gammaproteobacteria bacterium]MDA9094413.1 Na+-dependent nucleoside transporter [Gammaproteobacteria bacterium]MDA9112215.1 Na+-dependent nucleoside transporter [Gammaproteobacteria bacterium]MDB4059904.1 Na+-dependent nucleoside transporter [Gammaproteobacteria bacterium]MDB9997578.1 Na+-dependent nucleoside transporter [Gammaproteobacteria bacterium]|tara:strand:- start:6381 stop:7631 length:1251 start_codon:yes stop_codon:yes gene_type:complete